MRLFLRIAEGLCIVAIAAMFWLALFNGTVLPY